MKIALPVDQLNGLASEIAPNLRAAPALLIVDTATNTVGGIDTSSGMCGSFPADIQTIICAGGMGRGMFNGFKARGIRVFHSDHQTAGEAISALQANQLEEVKDAQCCGGGHHHNHDHDHHHGQGGCCHDHHDGDENTHGQCCGQH